MFERFTDRARRVVVLAEQEARLFKHNYIGPEHLLLGLLHEGEGVAGQALESLGISLGAARTQVQEVLGQGQNIPSDDAESAVVNKRAGDESELLSGDIEVRADSRKIFEVSLREALQLGHNYIGTEHILLGLIREGDGVAAEVLVKLGADRSRIRQQVIQLLSGYAGAVSRQARPEVLSQFGRNLTQLARDGKLDPIIGRAKEIERVMQVLSRRTKNNPVLIGEPGVGKTAIIEGLTQAIVKGEVPETLRNREVYTLDFHAITAGSRHRGEFEERLNRVVKEIRSQANIILFLEDLRNFGGAGSGEAGENALRKGLARQELQIICATTSSEYNRVIRADSNLHLAFQTIAVHAPSVVHTVELLKGVRDRYEAHHRVTITDDALVAAAVLADMYIKDRVLPGKAIDLIDDAGSRMRIRRMTAPPDLREFDDRIADIRRDKEAAIDAQDLTKAGALRDVENQLLKDKARREREWNPDDMDVVAEVDEEEVADALADLLGEDIVVITDERSDIGRGRRLLASLQLFQGSGDIWEIS
jgi:ATP-dependent Clp protease ATP-binding subunit ClpC